MMIKKRFNEWDPSVAAEFIKRWEGLRLHSYRCSANVWTIGYGHTKNVTAGQIITQQQADQFLLNDLSEHARGISKYVTCELTKGQYIALLSLVFNLGVGAIARSETLKRLNCGDIEGAKSGFLSFSGITQRDKDGNILRDENGKALKKVLPGLLNRRKAEVALL